MLNNLIKLLLDTNRLCLDGIEHDKSIPVETNPEFNELELKLRKELAYINAMDLRQGNVYLYKSQFDPQISKRFAKNVIFRAFPMIGKNRDLDGLPFKWKSLKDYYPYFFKFKTQIPISLRDQVFIRPYIGQYRIGNFGMDIVHDPDDIDNLYIEESYLSSIQYLFFGLHYNSIKNRKDYMSSALNESYLQYKISESIIEKKENLLM